MDASSFSKTRDPGSSGTVQNVSQSKASTMSQSIGVYLRGGIAHSTIASWTQGAHIVAPSRSYLLI